MKYESLVGTLFAGRFRIEKLLGKGGMGAVYLAEHEVLQRRFAIKIIRRSLLTDLSIASRFRREARAASRIDHPHITYVFDFGQSEEGIPYLAMEYVKGPLLAKEIERVKPFPVERALHILVQTAEALVAAHANMVVHRDLKPGNIVLCTQNNDPDFVKVLDFGLAKIVGLVSTGIPSDHGEVLGTPHYMSPEQCTGEKVDHRSDIYSFGVLAYEVLTGRRPFEGSAMKVISLHLDQDPPVPSENAERRDIPGQMDRIVQRCMAKKPSERYQSATEALGEIRSLQQIFVDATPLESRRTRARSEEFRALAPTISPAKAVPPKLGLYDDTVEGWSESTDADSQCHDDPLRMRSRALEELAFAVRDIGLGSAEISHMLAQKVEAEERAFELASSIALIESDLAEIETGSREREMRLRQALNQLEHERSLLAPRNPRQTMSWEGAEVQAVPGRGGGRLRSGEFAMQDHRLRQRIDGLVLKMQQLKEQAEKQQFSLHGRLAVKRSALMDVQQEVEQHEVQLEKLLRSVRSQIEELGDAELVRLQALAGC